MLLFWIVTLLVSDIGYATAKIIHFGEKGYYLGDKNQAPPHTVDVAAAFELYQSCCLLGFGSLFGSGSFGSGSLCGGRLAAAATCAALL